MPREFLGTHKTRWNGDLVSLQLVQATGAMQLMIGCSHIFTYLCYEKLHLTLGLTGISTCI